VEELPVLALPEKLLESLASAALITTGATGATVAVAVAALALAIGVDNMVVWSRVLLWVQSKLHVQAVVSHIGLPRPPVGHKIFASNNPAAVQHEGGGHKGVNLPLFLSNLFFVIKLSETILDLF